LGRWTVLARLLAPVGVGALLFACGIVASAAGAAFVGTIQPGCVVAGQPLTIALTGTGGNAVVYERITYADTAAGGGLQTTVGQADTQGAFTATFTIPATAESGAGSVLVIVFDPEEAAVSYPANFTVGTSASCSNPGVSQIVGAHFSLVARYQVKKVCDPGVSGNAVFRIAITVGVRSSTVGSPQSTVNAIATFDFPATLTLSCNGAPGFLPTLPLGSAVALHEAVLPTGAAAAGTDTKVDYPPQQAQLPVTIHNARASAISASTPPALAQTGAGRQFASVLWRLALVALLVWADAWILVNVRRRPRV